MSHPLDGHEYSISSVSALTGLSTHTIRMWERRYGFPLPHRSALNERRYTLEQVEALRLVSANIHAGRPIAEIVADFHAGRLRPRSKFVIAEPLSATAARFVDLLLAGEVNAIAAIATMLRRRLTPADVIARVLDPAFKVIGDRCECGEIEARQESFAVSELRGLIGKLRDAACAGNTAPIRSAILATMQGEQHEGGVLLVQVLLESAGWRVYNLGLDVGIDELRRGVKKLQVDAVGISFVLSRNIKRRFEELATIRDVPVFVGGRGMDDLGREARKRGLIPLIGSASTTLPIWLGQFENHPHPPTGLRG